MNIMNINYNIFIVNFMRKIYTSSMFSSNFGGNFNNYYTDHYIY